MTSPQPDLTVAIPAALAHVCPSLSPQARAAWTPALVPPLRASGIVTDQRLAMFLGQCAVESDRFNRLEEDLYYLTAARIADVFPREIPTEYDARAFVGNPQALANRVYANRMGNGDELSGDGWRFRGRGLIGLTGRQAYTTFAASVGRPLADVTDWAATPPGAAASACWFWTKRGLNALADQWEIGMTTCRINPAGQASAERIQACHAALLALVAARSGLAPGGLAAASGRVAPSVPAPDSGQQEVTADSLMAAELKTIQSGA